MLILVLGLFNIFISFAALTKADRYATIMSNIKGIEKVAPLDSGR